MSAKSSVTIFVGLAAVAWLAACLIGSLGAPRNAEVVVEMAYRVKGATSANGASAEVSEGRPASLKPLTYADLETRERESTAEESSFAYQHPDSWFELNIGRNYEDCKKKRLERDVCKQWFEARDEEWATKTERQIDALVSAMEAARLSTNDKLRVPNVECRTTLCVLHLDVDLPALVDHLRRIGQWDETSPNKLAGATKGGWDRDRAEELRLGLVVSGLIQGDADVDVKGFITMPGEQDHPILRLLLHRCSNRYEFCEAR